MKSRAIVTLADSNYFELLLELIDSIKKYKESENVSICVLDAGLKDQEIEIIKKKVYSIKKAKWDIEVPSHKVLGREWLKSQVSRAFIPNYFPEFEHYDWKLIEEKFYPSEGENIPSWSYNVFLKRV